MTNMLRTNFVELRLGEVRRIHLLGKPPSPCTEAAKEKVDGLDLCERHVLEAKLERQIECWVEMLFHIELWSREARRRERQDVVGLLEDERAQAMEML